MSQSASNTQLEIQVGKVYECADGHLRYVQEIDPPGQYPSLQNIYYLESYPDRGRGFAASRYCTTKAKFLNLVVRIREDVIPNNR